MAWQTEITGITSETGHLIEVIAVNEAGDSEPAVLTAPTSAYPSPANPRVVAGSIGQTFYTIECDPVPGTPDGYRVYLNDASIIGFSVGGSTQVEVSGRTAGSTESITVRAYDGGGEGDSSLPVSITLKPANPVIAISTDPNSVQTTSVKILWTPVNGATSYSLYIDNVLRTTSASTPHTVTLPESGTTYAIKLTADNASGSSGYSNVLSPQTLYLAPTLVGVSGITQTGYTVTCMAVSGAPTPEGYHVYSGGTLIGSSTSGNTSIVISGRDAGSIDYNVKMAAYNGDLIGELSTETTVTMLPQAVIVSLFASNPPSVSSDSIKIQWNQSVGATDYFLSLNGIVDAASLSSPFDILELDPNTVYDIIIQAANVSGISESVALVQKTGPEVPIDIVVGGVTSTTFNLTWGSSSGAEKYRVYINNVLQPTEYLGNSAVDLNFPAPGNSCSVEVVAQSTYNTQILSSRRSDAVVVYPAAPVAAPDSIGPVTVTETTFTVTDWSGVVAATYYILNQDGLDDAEHYVSPPAVAVPFLSFAAATTLKMRACNSGGCGPLSTASQTISPAAPTTPITIDGPVDDIDPREYPLVFVWNERINADTYEIQIATDSGFTSIEKTIIDIGSSPYVLESGLEEGEKYYWHIRYHNVSGTSPWSDTYSFILNFSPVFALYPEADATGIPLAPLLNWDPSAFRGIPGDLAIIRVNASGSPSDNFSILALADIPADQPIKWTDNGWTDGTGFRSGETMRTISDHGGLLTGQIYEVSGAALTSSGEQLFLYSGDSGATDAAAAKFIYGINWGDTDGWDLASTTASTSALPDTLFGANVVLLGNGAWYYNGPRTGTKQQMLNFINDPAMWAIDVGAVKNSWSDISGDTFSITPKPGITYDWKLATDVGLDNIVVDGTDVTYHQYQVTGGILGLLTDYYLGIRKKSSFVTGSWGVSGFTTISPVTVPVLVAPANGATDVLRAPTMQWEASTGTAPIYYNLQIATDISFALGDLVYTMSDLSALTHQASGLEFSTNYYWRVLAYDVNGPSAWSEPSPFTVAAQVGQPTLALPADSATNQATSLTFSWEVVTGIGSVTYEIQVDDDQTFATPIVDATGITGLSYNAIGLSYETMYYWHARAVDGNGPGAWTPPRILTTVVAPPEVPDLAASVGDGAINQPTTMNFVWGAAARADSYLLQVSTNSSFTTYEFNENIGNVLEHELHLTAFAAYWWKVTAINNGGQSTTVPRTFTTGIDVPVLSTVANDETSQLGGRVNISWLIHEATSITNIKVKKGTSSGTYSDSVTLDASARTYLWAGLNNNEMYYFVVSSVGNGMETIDSNEMSVIPSDAGAPDSATAFSAETVPTGEAITLTWTNPAVDFDHVVIVRKDGSFATTPSDPSAVIIYTGTGTTFTDTGS